MIKNFSMTLLIPYYKRMCFANTFCELSSFFIQAVPMLWVDCKLNEAKMPAIAQQFLTDVAK